MQHIGKKENKLQLLINLALSYIFPIECASCQKEGEYLCSACFAKIEYIEKFPCFICNQGHSIEGICSDCKTKSGIDQIIIATTYLHNFVGQLVEDLKYNYLESVSNLLAEIIYKQIQRKNLKQLFENSLLIPVPLHKKRFAERGFNQAELLAQKLAKQFKITIDSSLVSRPVNTLQQAKLSRQSRLQNIENAFRIGSISNVPNEVILIDDVLTTGATFIELCKCLKAKGVQRVTCVAVCHG